MDQNSFTTKITRTTTTTTTVDDDDDDEVEYEFFPFIRTYKSGRIQRLVGNTFLSPSDTVTGVSSKDVPITPDSSVSARLFLPKSTPPCKKLPVLVYYHGGAFVCEHNASPFYHNYLNSVVSHANVLAVSVNYRLAPEYHLPAAYLDSWTAVRWVASKNDPWLEEHADLSHVFLMGDSAGGNICQWVAMKAGEEELPGKVGIEGMVLVHCFFWGKEPLGSESRDPAYREAMEKSWLFVYPEAGEDGSDHPWLNPAVKGAPSLEGLGCRRVLMCIGGVDFFKDRGLAYVEKLKESGWGGEVEALVSEGEGHVFHMIKPNCDKAVEMMERIGSFIDSNN